jgi:hypothetical protein
VYFFVLYNTVLYNTVLYNTIEAFALLHLGEWGRLQQSVAAALAMTLFRRARKLQIRSDLRHLRLCGPEIGASGEGRLLIT